MANPSPVVDDLPPRQPWEEPPPAGWSSQLSGIGLETLWLLSSLATALAAYRLGSWARQFGEQPTVGWHTVLVVAAWCLTCILGSTIALYVWKRFGGLSVVGAMLTDYGRAARLGGRPPVFLDAPPERALRIAHLSDLHIAEGPRVRMVERASPAGNQRLSPLLDQPQIRESDLLLFTGDITDRGTAIAWRWFLDALSERGLTDRAVLVPGNHDLSLVDQLDGDHRKRVLRADRFGIVQLANLLKFAEAFAETGGGQRGKVYDEDSGEALPFVEVWQKVDTDVRPLVAALPDLPVPGRRNREAIGNYIARIEVARNRLLGLFPVAVPIADDTLLFVLNSCAALSRHPATNALGHVGRPQYHRLTRLAALLPATTKLVALHHHVVRRTEERAWDLVTRVMAKFTVLGDARPLVRFCKKESVRVVMNGHRHLSYQLRLPNGTVLLAAPSSTLGDELARDPRPQFEQYYIAPTVIEPSVGIYQSVIRPGI